MGRGGGLKKWQRGEMEPAKVAKYLSSLRNSWDQLKFSNTKFPDYLLSSSIIMILKHSDILTEVF